MNVRELIDKLSKYDPESEVYVTANLGSGYESIYTIDINKDHNGDVELYVVGD